MGETQVLNEQFSLCAIVILCAMSILQKLDSDLRQALKSGDKARLATIRLIKSTAKNKEIEIGGALSEPQFFAVLSSMIRERRESIDQFKKGGRDDLVKKEEGEIVFIEAYLPQPLNDSELSSLVDKAIESVGASGMKDMGAVMKQLKDKTAGRVDGRKLADVVREKLGQLS